jgi:hypothetical protein
MSVGDTHTIQALNSLSQPVTGLTWASSDPTIVNLSPDDPPILTALAAGHVTITAGTASADVTVSTALPLGTVIWSNPGDGSGVTSIVPAVPSTSGVADVFAFQSDGTVQAITSDGTTAWTADVSNAWPVLPDFQGGLIALNSNGSSLYKLDGITGQPYPAYTPDPQSGFADLPFAVHPDGTVIAVVQDTDNGLYSVIGIDPTTGTSKFSVPVLAPAGGGPSAVAGNMIVAGDGYAYVPYRSHDVDGSGWGPGAHWGLLRVNSSGAYRGRPGQPELRSFF